MSRPRKAKTARSAPKTPAPISRKLRALIDRDERTLAAFGKALDRIEVVDREKLAEGRHTDNAEDKRLKLEIKAGNAHDASFEALLSYVPANTDELVLYLNHVLHNFRTVDGELTALQA